MAIGGFFQSIKDLIIKKEEKTETQEKKISLLQKIILFLRRIF